jgi:hypothetical protein
MGRGKLVFKNDEKSATKTKKRVKHYSHAAAAAVVLPATTPVTTTAVASSPSLAPSAHVPKVMNGTGLIATSGTVVTGHETQFTRQLNVGDAVLVGHEMRVVTMRLGDTSLNLSSAFSRPIKQPMAFQYMNKPRNAANEARVAKEQARDDAKLVETHAFGTYSSSTELVYREKTETGSYRIKKVVLEGDNTTRGDLLEMRTKRKSDKYC